MPRPRALAEPGLFVRAAFLDADTRSRIMQAVRQSPGEPAEVLTGDQELTHDDSARRAWEVLLPGDLLDALIGRIDALGPELDRVFGIRLQPCDGLAALRYPPGAFYGLHRDVAEAPHPLGLHLRRVSIVIFVNGTGDPASPFAGGHLRLYDGFEDSQAPRVVDLEPEAGTLVAFRSDLLHEVTPVERGERCTIVTWLNLRSGEANEVRPL